MKADPVTHPIAMAPWIGGESGANAGAVHSAQIIRVGDAELDRSTLELRRDGRRVVLRPLPARLLMYLIQNRNRVVPKAELFEHLWPDTFVGDAALASALRDLRRAVGDDGASQEIIRTHRRLGYRLAARVSFDHFVADSAPAVLVPASDHRDAVRDIPRPHISAALHRVACRAAAGAGSVVALEGPAQCGRTTALRRFSAECESTVFSFQCRAEPWRPAFDLVGESLLRLETHFGSDRFERWVGRHSSIGAVLPELAAPRVAELSEITESVARLMMRAAESEPFVIVVDDAQNGDRDSLALLSELAPLLKTSRAVIVLGWSTTVPGHQAPHRRAGTIRMNGLGIEELRQWLDDIAPRQFDDDWALRLMHWTSGHLPHIRQIVHAALDAPGPVADPEELSANSAIRRDIGDRLRRLSPRVQRLIMVAAASSGLVEARRIAKFADIRSGATVAVDEAVRSGLLVRSSDGPTLRAVSPVVRDALLKQLDSRYALQLDRLVQRLNGN